MNKIRSIAFLALIFFSEYVFATPAYRAVTIPTRDGKFLAADIYATDSTTPKPVILIQTPYDKNFYRIGVVLPQSGGATFPYDSVHYNYVIVDWRGYYGSIAATVANYDRGLDGYDCTEWIAQQKWSDGKVGTWGASALGEIQFQTAKHHPPHLVCIAPAVKDFETRYDQYFCGGDYRQEHVQSLDSLGFLKTSTITSHPDSDLTWTVAHNTTDYPDSINLPTLMIGGWFDHFPDDVIRAFSDLQNFGDPSARTQYKFLIGPWMHTALDQLQQGVWQFPNAVGVADSLAFLFFARYLLGEQNNWELQPLVRYYQIGANEWRTANDWQSVATGTTTFYLQPGGTLSPTPLAGNATIATIVDDPRNPSPTIGGSRFNPFDKTILLGPQDQRALVESRKDVISFTTNVLTSDLVVDGTTTFSGLITCDRPDADISIRLCDVQPDSSSILLTQGIFRLRFHESFATENFLVPGTIYPVTIPLQNLAITFPAGHRIRIDLSGSDYPMFDNNLNNGGKMYTAGDTNIATISVINNLQPATLVLQTGSPSNVAPAPAQTPRDFILSISPNPIHDNATITMNSFSLSDATIEIIDMLGRRVATIFHGRLNYGGQSFVYHVHDLPSGVFWCRAQTGNFSHQYFLEIQR